MAIDMAARLKELREKKAAELKAKEIQDAQVQTVQKPIEETSVVHEIDNQASQEVKNSTEQTPSQVETKPATTTNTIGTTKTSEIDHLAFMSNMEELKDAILNQHPKMPVLLMMIHKHLRTDPELVTTLSEEEIGVIVNGLKIQTKTELTGTALKAPKGKKTVLSLDMF